MRTGMRIGLVIRPPANLSPLASTSCGRRAAGFAVSVVSFSSSPEPAGDDGRSQPLRPMASITNSLPFRRNDNPPWCCNRLSIDHGGRAVARRRVRADDQDGAPAIVRHSVGPYRLSNHGAVRRCDNAACIVAGDAVAERGIVGGSRIGIGRKPIPSPERHPCRCASGAVAHPLPAPRRCGRRRTP